MEISECFFIVPFSTYGIGWLLFYANLVFISLNLQASLLELQRRLAIFYLSLEAPLNFFYLFKCRDAEIKSDSVFRNP